MKKLVITVMATMLLVMSGCGAKIKTEVKPSFDASPAIASAIRSCYLVSGLQRGILPEDILKGFSIGAGPHRTIIYLVVNTTNGSVKSVNVI